MKYVYDVMLDFQENYYEFYEWNKNDKIINVKKIMVYKISIDDYNNIKNKDVVINIDKKMFLISNGIEVMGILLDNKGRVIKRSSMIFSEMDDTNKRIKNTNDIDIKYEIIGTKKDIGKSRIKLEKERYLSKYLDKIRNNEYLLKYIYYDIFNKEENDTKKIYNELEYLYKNNIDELYNNIKNIDKKKEIL